ncbi:MAG: glycoside hydrolase family 127 protein [Bacteroidales bacterium]|nr:glycoside hydrolase family 127 protein [Bacteroidales bacterium]
MRRKVVLLSCLLAGSLLLTAQNRGMVNTYNSRHARIWNADVTSVAWTDGFWGDRFEVCRDTMVLNMWHIMNDPELCHAYRNLEIAAGEAQGDHHGPAFHDGDFFKWFESMAAVYAVTRDPALDKLMDKIIATIAKAQREDGYMHTQVIIPERNRRKSATDNRGLVGTATGTAEGGAFNNRLNFETYNHGHLMMAACVHYRATGKRTLLDVAIKATDFLYNFYKTASAELARNAICPSHYMGVVEMYRVTGDPRYLELARNLIDIRGMVQNGTDDNQDRVPFREQMNAMGHAVRANYLYAGVADVYAETGDESLMRNLESIWSDIVNHKMYITGGCGALYDGTSPDGTCYTPDSIQKVHQSYGRAFQLPNSTAHNETCANIGNLLFNWRMFQISGDGKYNDIVERVLYNSLLSGISLDGTKYFYTNPLRLSDKFPYVLRWPKERTPYISCFCCPPNTVRTICEAQNYAYALSEEGVWCNLYGGSKLDTRLKDGSAVLLSQQSAYPWDGEVSITVGKAPRKKEMSIFLHIPAWCDHFTVRVNGQPVKAVADKGYACVRRVWKKNDVLQLSLEMKAKLIESNPLLEETRNQVAVMRGPVVYCLESSDLNGLDIDKVVIPASASFQPEMIEIDGAPMAALTGEALYLADDEWQDTLYREVRQGERKIRVRLIPYYAFGNRGHSEMTVWMPLNR